MPPIPSYVCVANRSVNLRRPPSCSQKRKADRTTNDPECSYGSPYRGKRSCCFHQLNTPIKKTQTTNVLSITKEKTKSQNQLPKKEKNPGHLLSEHQLSPHRPLLRKSERLRFEKINHASLKLNFYKLPMTNKVKYIESLVQTTIDTYNSQRTIKLSVLKICHRNFVHNYDAVLLFHGTSIDAAHQIAQKGFQRVFNRDGKWDGIFLSPKPVFSLGYCVSHREKIKHDNRCALIVCMLPDTIINDRSIYSLGLPELVLRSQEHIKMINIISIVTVKFTMQN